VVDRLLASPRRAESLALAWLDAAAMPTPNGYNNDEEADHVAVARLGAARLRANMPLTVSSPNSLPRSFARRHGPISGIATGFTASRHTRPKGHHRRGVSRRVRRRRGSHLQHGLSRPVDTVAPRCHDHKYDPVLQREYYGLFSFLTTSPNA